MSDRLQQIWREIWREFWLAPLFVAFWGVWTWILGAILGVLVAIAHYAGAPMIIAYTLFGAFITFALLVVVGRIMGRPATNQNSTRTQVPEPKAHVESPKRQIPTETLEAPKATAVAAVAQPETPNPRPQKQAVDAISDTERAAKYFDTFAPQPARRSTDYDVSYWIKLGTLYGVQNGILTLGFLPDTYNRDGDALLLLLYGYRQIYDRKQVEAWKLEQGLYLSRCRKRLPPQTALEIATESLIGRRRDDRIAVDELAKSWALEGKISEKFGLASGGFYSITDKGLTETEKLFDDLVRRA